MPEQTTNNPIPSTSTPHHSFLPWIGVVLIIAAIAAFIVLRPKSDPVNAPTLADNIRTGKMPRPPVTDASTIHALEQGNGFQAVVSYTDIGFEPHNVSVKAGETVRFINNSSNDLWITANGPIIYPHTQDSCGASDFDSCRQLKPQEYWEFTFTVPGEWAFGNNLNLHSSGVIHVRE